jgi:P-type E1-E2 ATPase
VKALTATPGARCHELVPGDIIFVQEGDQIPADCRLLEGFGMQVNNAALTESAAARSARPTYQR